jgi:AraC-like DNA-binding protein/mannose-6-phosphate isomerase-like protein (cupin superfamily)
MGLYRKYFNEQQIQTLVESEPNWGVNIITVGHYVHIPQTKYPDTKHPASHYFSWEVGRRLSEYQMVYIANGKGIIETEYTPSVEVHEGTLLLLFPNVWHRYRPLEGTGWEEFWVGFDGHYAEYLMRQECFDPQKPILDIGFNAEFLNVFIRLIDTVKNEGVAFRQICSCLVIQLLGLIYASALLSDKSRTRQETAIRAIRYKIHQHWAEDLDMEKLAREQKISYVLFRKSFKDILGISPGQYHLNLKIEKSAQMLKETDFSIAKIAESAGFESEFYFSRFFKKKMGVPPSTYRKN